MWASLAIDVACRGGGRILSCGIHEKSMNVVLASSSPRRKRLLGRLVGGFSVKTADIEEHVGRDEGFARAAVRLAETKARAAWNGRALVIGADTIAYRGKKMFRKTESAGVARRILTALRGNTHGVVTGVALVFPDGRCVKYAAKARVKMRNWERGEIEGYLRGGEWRGRAGCYDVSGEGEGLVESILGEKETVVGLPLVKLGKILSEEKFGERKKNHY